MIGVLLGVDFRIIGSLQCHVSPFPDDVCAAAACTCRMIYIISSKLTV